MIKVRVTLSIELDAEAWRDTYGPNTTVREDVRAHVHNLVQNSAPFDGEVDGTVTLVD